MPQRPAGLGEADPPQRAFWHPREVSGALLDLVLPRSCVGCGGPAGPWCPDCAAWLEHQPGQDTRLANGLRVVSAAPYQGPVRQLVTAVKDRFRSDAIDVMAVLLAQACASVSPSPAVLVPVPSRDAANRHRGQFVMGAVAERAARLLGDDWQSFGAFRTRRGVSDQHGLSRVDRQHNLRGAFELPSANFLSDKNIVVVDDVITTGASLAESHRLLAAVNARSIAAATVSWS